MKLYYIIVSSRTAVKENRFSGLFLPEKHDKLIKKRETRTSRMRISRLLVCLCLLALLCACAAPAAALPETPAEATAAPEPVPTEPPVPAEPVEVPVAAEEPEPEAAVLPAEPVWVLGRLTDVYSTRESEWIRAEDVPEDAPMQTLNEVFTGEETLWAAVADILESAAPLQPEPGILDDLIYQLRRTGLCKAGRRGCAPWPRMGAGAGREPVSSEAADRRRDPGGVERAGADVPRGG